MNKPMLYVKWFSYLFILIFLFILCALIGVRYIFGEDGNLAWVILQLGLIKSYPLTPYIKEIALGLLSFFCLSYIALRYWKISVVCCLLVVSVFLGKNILSNKSSSIFSSEYLVPRVYLSKNVTHKNIIVISLESIEDILAIDNITKSGNLIPNLSLLKKEGMILNGYVDMMSMRPTIPSFFAKNCGIPSRTKDMDIYNRWANKTDYTQFPNAKCVFDVLRDTGYHTYYLMGSYLTDEGAASFFEKHPAELALGKQELLEKGVSQKESHHTLPDSELYKYAEKLLSSQQNRPFGLYIVTANTHGAQKGGYYVENGCNKRFGDFRDAIQCLDKVTYDFIKWCQSQDWYKNTVIYLIGDHLMRPSELRIFSDEAEKYPRQVFTLMLNGNRTDKSLERKYTQVDFAPSFLESLGFVSPALGLGRSLFREEQTLVEKFGEKKFESEIQNSWNDFQNIMHQKTFATDIQDLEVARIDIQTKLVNAEIPQFDVYVDDSKTAEQQAGWMPKYGSQGYVVQKAGNNMTINIKSHMDGNIRLTLRGRERRLNNEFVPVWVTYTSLKVDDEEVLTNPETVWHSKGWEYNIKTDIGKEYKIYMKWKKAEKIPEE